MGAHGEIEIHQQVPTRSHALCERLLHEIAASHGHADDDMDCSTATSQWARAREEKAVDIVISGGGLKGYFVTGASVVLKKELDARGIKIARTSGTSAGAWAAMFLLLGITTNDWIETYYACQDRSHLTIHDAYESVIPWLKQRLPENSWEICNHRLHICVTEVTMTGLKRHVINEFHNNDDLYEACLASSTIPILSEKAGLRRFRNMWVIDGGLTSNLPMFEDNAHPQLIFNLSHVHYSFQLLIAPKDPCIEALVLRGAMMMSRFLKHQTHHHSHHHHHQHHHHQHQPSGKKDKSISWLDWEVYQQRQQERRLAHQQSSWWRFCRYSLLPAVVLGYLATTLNGKEGISAGSIPVSIMGLP